MDALRLASAAAALCALALAVPAAPAVAADDAPAACRVSLTTNPSGATAIIDGRDRGVTPVTLYDLEPGRHLLKLRLAGHDESVRFIDTRRSPVVEQNTVLEETKGLLLLKTVPEGADVQVDGMSVGQTPRLIANLPVGGVYQVRLRKAGYQDQTISVRFDGRRPQVREERLVLASGTIDVMSEPTGAEVTVNGIVRGKAPLRVTGVPKGRAIVKFSLPGYEDAVRDLAVSAGDVQALPVVLKGLPGTLRVTTVPDGARIYVNDRFEGKSPLSLAGLAPGEYAVRAELDGHGFQTRTVTLENGSSASEEFRLSSVMGCIEVVTAPAGAQVTVDGRAVGTTKSRDPAAEFSDPLLVESVHAGEHRVVISKDGFAERSLLAQVENRKTSQHRVRLRRVFVPDCEIVTARGTYRGVLVSANGDSVTLEVSLGITQSFPRSEIRKVTPLEGKGKDGRQDQL